MNNKYHTALNDKKQTTEFIQGTERFSSQYCTAFKYDFIPVKVLPKEYNECDFLYVEVPYPQGIKIFDERANIKQARNVDDFALALREIIQDCKKPIGIVTSKILHKKLPTPTDTYEMKIHVGKVTFALHNLDCKYKFRTSSELMNFVANQFNCLGDFCCGYGFPLMEFLNYGGKKIIASDYNDKCITILKQKIEQYEQKF